MSNQDGFGGAQTSFFFGPFELQLDRNVLLRDQMQIKIGSRAFDLLTLLVLRAGELVTKDELRAHIWPKLFVEHTNLKVTVSNLRRILGDTGTAPHFVATVSGRGYRFIAQVTKYPDVQNRWRNSAVFGDCPVVALVNTGETDSRILAIVRTYGLLEGFPEKICLIDLSAIQADRSPPPISEPARRVF